MVMIFQGGHSLQAEDLDRKPVSSRGQRHPGVTGAVAALLPTQLSIEHHQRSTPASVAAASPYHHVLVFLQYDVGIVVEVEHRDGVELGGGAAWLRYVLGVHQVHLKIKENTLSTLLHKRSAPFMDWGV